MLDFLSVTQNPSKKGVVELKPKFKVMSSNDLMVRGGDFYAIWNEKEGLWSKDKSVAVRLIDEEIKEYYDRLVGDDKNYETNYYPKYLWDSDTGSIDKWHKFCQKQMWDQYHQLDEKVIFANSDTKKEDYASKRLPYSLEPGNCPSYEKLISTLYTPDERAKIEWAIGSIIAGDSKKIQKFLVFYGSAGSGKSTILNIVQQLFEGYYSMFDAKALASSNNMFALESFKHNPLIGIQHDGDLSRIEDNTKLNSIVSHERMEINEKFKSMYDTKLNAFLFMGTNKPVRITEAKSGLIRRLIDVRPSGVKIPYGTYVQLVNNIKFELGAIASHCLEVYKSMGEDYYENYIPKDMMSATNDFYDFVESHYEDFKKSDYVTLKDAWDMYKKYCEYAQVSYPYPMRAVRVELKNYFDEYRDQYQTPDKHLRNVYIGFKTDKFFYEKMEKKEEQPQDMKWLFFNEEKSIFDDVCGSCFAQYANDKETPIKKWVDVDSCLRDLDTTQLHYVMVPDNHIVIDFDLKDSDGNKSLDMNLEAANKWPKTYAELSKSGSGIHLHYIYSGDVEKLSRIYEEGIEVKVFTGNSSLRRKLTKCNDIPIATINSGLPLKGGKNVINFDGVKNEKALRTLIKNSLDKKHHGATKPEIDLIYKNLDDAYKSGMEYDVTDLRPKVLAFANNSTHQSEYCVKLVSKMKFYSDKVNDAETTVDSDGDLVFYDVEVFPNLFVIVWKRLDGPINKMINPDAMDVEKLTNFKLVGFNNRRYDNHILYARILGYDNHQLYELSQKIINGSKNATFGGAYNLSYTDIYDFASAGNKKSLKKFEIELGIHHQELGLMWDQPVPEEKWNLVAEYCVNDVLATEAVFKHLKADWTARQILADMAGMSVNSSTNSLTQKIIFGNDRSPQSSFNYRNLAEPVKELEPDMYEFLSEACPNMMSVDHGEEESLLPYFPGYEYDAGVSTYKDIKVGEGGYVYAEPGMYGNVALLDVSSMHPHSAIAEVLFGTEYTKIFRDIVEGRVSIKHEDWDSVNKIMDGKLSPYIQKVKEGEMTSKDLANALKTAINSVYGLTSAKFDNPFRDVRNKDNIVAKRGALFMIDLQKAVQKKGYTVAHIKTDSIKIPDATPQIIEFVKEFGEKYGYTFEHEATYDKMCLVNDAVYIARYPDGTWTATGAQFAQPYVFKTLFSHEPIVFEDMCEVKSVTSALYLDMNEALPEDEHDYQFIGRVGLFCPIKPGHGGGILYRFKDDKFNSVTGTKGYRWLEAETVKNLKMEDAIDRSYYTSLVDEAIQDISKHGDFEWFVSDDPYDGRFDLPF